MRLVSLHIGKSMADLSIHDNRVTSYLVDGEQRCIVLHTVFEDRGPKERTDAVFEGVLAYQFENDNFGNILSGVAEVSAESIFQDSRQLFVEGESFCWPGSWNKSEAECLSYIHSCGVDGYLVCSSYGLSGWVLARSYVLKPHNDGSATWQAAASVRSGPVRLDALGAVPFH